MALIIGGTAAHEIAKSLLGQVHIQQKTGLDRKKKRKEKKKEKKKKRLQQEIFQNFCKDDKCPLLWSGISDRKTSSGI